ncbi:hypothetical protein [Pontibacter indicus]|uniref:hypothetical protein n=1 Tax=Pontibacter indicus TaxID=1317125 RepID=UPI00147BE176|nr:hypothetical protein [Pontibacter indicus]
MFLLNGVTLKGRNLIKISLDLTRQVCSARLQNHPETSMPEVLSRLLKRQAA